MCVCARIQKNQQKVRHVTAPVHTLVLRNFLVMQVSEGVENRGNGMSKQGISKMPTSTLVDQSDNIPAAGWWVANLR